MDNPEVFPQSAHPDGPFGGMTLLDYFAGQVLPAIYDQHDTTEKIARAAYHMAQAMLTARIEAIEQ